MIEIKPCDCGKYPVIEDVVFCIAFMKDVDLTQLELEFLKSMLISMSEYIS